MRRTKVMLFIAIMLGGVMIVHAQAPLSVLIGSGTHADGMLDIITPSDRMDEIITYNNSSISSNPTQAWDVQPGWNIASLEIPDYPYIGFRGTADNVRLNPIYWNQASTPPAAIHTPLETDPAGDHLYTSTWLDIRSTEMSFSNERLYFGIKNTSNTFPTSSGLTYFSYMIVLVDPDADPESNPTVYGLMYTVNVPGVIGPGLYKITGTGFSDLTRIGDITATVDASTSTLRISCALTDLTNDADFSSWYNPQYPRLITTAITSRISLVNGTQQSDITSGMELLLLPQMLPTQNQYLPVLSNASVQVLSNVSEQMVCQVTYADADPNFPRQAFLNVDGMGAIPMTVMSGSEIDFTAGVRYEAIIDPAPESWSEAVFTFSHGDESIQTTVSNIVPSSDPLSPPASIRLSLMPNPVQSSLNIKVEGLERVSKIVEIYNLKGQRIYHALMFVDDLDISTSQLPAGIYFARITGQEGQRAVERFTRIP